MICKYTVPGSFLELNEKQEFLQFVEIKEKFRTGTSAASIRTALLTCSRSNDVNVKTSGNPSIHLELGIRIGIPATKNPADPEALTRLANIRYGTSPVSQPIATVAPLPLTFPAAELTPLVINQPTKPIQFSEPNLATATNFRTPSQVISLVTQQIVDNSNVVLAAGIADKTIKSVMQSRISTVDLDPPPTSGVEPRTSTFLPVAGKPNADVLLTPATLWISDFVDPQANPGRCCSTRRAFSES